MDIKNVSIHNWIAYEGFGLVCRWCVEPLHDEAHTNLTVPELLELIKATTHECAPAESFEAQTTIPVHDDGPYRDPDSGEPLCSHCGWLAIACERLPTGSKCCVRCDH